jgi:D-aminopeptidase
MLPYMRRGLLAAALGHVKIPEALCSGDDKIYRGTTPFIGNKPINSSDSNKSSVMITEPAGVS